MSKEGMVRAYSTVGLLNGARQIVFKFLNKIHYGEESVPMDVQPPESLLEATRRAMMHRGLTFDFKILKDGRYQIAKINDINVEDKHIVI